MMFSLQSLPLKPIFSSLLVLGLLSSVPAMAMDCKDGAPLPSDIEESGRHGMTVGQRADPNSDNEIDSDDGYNMTDAERQEAEDDLEFLHRDERCAPIYERDRALWDYDFTVEDSVTQLLTRFKFIESGPRKNFCEKMTKLIKMDKAKGKAVLEVFADNGNVSCKLYRIRDRINEQTEDGHVRCFDYHINAGIQELLEWQESGEDFIYQARKLLQDFSSEIAAYRRSGGQGADNNIRPPAKNNLRERVENKSTPPAENKSREGVEDINTVPAVSALPAASKRAQPAENNRRGQVCCGALRVISSAVRFLWDYVVE